MKRYNVRVEEFNRIDDSVSGGALIDEWFDTEEDAREYYDHIDIAGEYKSDLSRAEKRERYVEKSLACGEWVDDDGEMIFDGNGIDFIDTESAGKHYSDSYGYRDLYLVETADGKREFWTVGNEYGVITLRSTSTEADTCESEVNDKYWDDRLLSDYEYDHLFDDVKVIDQRDYDVE